MSKKTRTIELYRLTISGLPESVSYDHLLQKIAGAIPKSRKYLKINSKHYSIEKCSVSEKVTKVLFTSYKEGSRPDVLDTKTNAILKNPMPDNFESVEYTHVLGFLKNDKYLLILELNPQGIWANTIARFIEICCKHYSSKIFGEGLYPKEEIIVNLEPVPGRSFQEKVEGLQRITKATLRIVKPNPCWDDLESELGGMSKESNARMVEVTSTAPRGKSLSKMSGIVRYIFDLFQKKHLDGAIIEGKTAEKTTERFTTKNENIKEKVTVSQNANGQINSDEMYNEMEILTSTDELD